jgi:hypothetical protein
VAWPQGWGRAVAGKTEETSGFIERMYSRSGTESLPSHLEGRYGIQVAGLTELDLGVFRVDRHDGPSWLARVFPAVRPIEEAKGDAAMLWCCELDTADVLDRKAQVLAAQPAPAGCERIPVAADLRAEWRRARCGT